MPNTPQPATPEQVIERCEATLQYVKESHWLHDNELMLHADSAAQDAIDMAELVIAMTPKSEREKAWLARALKAEQQVQSLLDVRPCVLEFALETERILKLNDHKPGWHNDSEVTMMVRLREEVTELGNEVVLQYCDGHDAKLQKEAVDVANIAMMIWDINRRRALTPRAEEG